MREVVKNPEESDDLVAFEVKAFHGSQDFSQEVIEEVVANSNVLAMRGLCPPITTHDANFPLVGYANSFCIGHRLGEKYIAAKCFLYSDASWLLKTISPQVIQFGVGEMLGKGGARKSILPVMTIACIVLMRTKNSTSFVFRS